MEILREVDGIKLNKGNLMANGLYNLIDENNNVSSWFGEDTKDELISMSDNSFWNYASVLIFDANFPNL